MVFDLFDHRKGLLARRAWRHHDLSEHEALVLFRQEAGRRFGIKITGSRDDQSVNQQEGITVFNHAFHAATVAVGCAGEVAIKPTEKAAGFFLFIHGSK